jgi:hypothetical protein
LINLNFQDYTVRSFKSIEPPWYGPVRRVV